MVVLAGGAVIAAAGTALGLRRLEYERVPQVAMLSAVFFVASLIHVPVGVTSVHLVLNGLMGLVLGWAAFPAILVALFLQVLFFSFGGLTTLGVNTVIMALPAVAVYCLFHRAVRCRHETAALGAGFLAGAVAIVFAALLQMGAILSVGQSFGTPCSGADRAPAGGRSRRFRDGRRGPVSPQGAARASRCPAADAGRSGELGWLARIIHVRSVLADSLPRCAEAVGCPLRPHNSQRGPSLPGYRGSSS